MEEVNKVWREEFVLGIAALDEQHREMADCIQALLGAEGRAPEELQGRLAALRRAARDHFELEEKWMARVGFPGEAEHRFQHDYLLHELEHFGQALAPGRSVDREELATFLLVWFEEHLTEMDRPLAAFLRRSSPVAEQPG